MCGIVGYIGKHEAVPIILEGLKQLEYRGYDSAGLAVYPPILRHTRDVFFLADGDMAILTPGGVTLRDFDGHHISRELCPGPLGSYHGRKGRLQAFHA